MRPANAQDALARHQRFVVVVRDDVEAVGERIAEIGLNGALGPEIVLHAPAHDDADLAPLALQQAVEHGGAGIDSSLEVREARVQPQVPVVQCVLRRLDEADRFIVRRRLRLADDEVAVLIDQEGIRHRPRPRRWRGFAGSARSRASLASPSRKPGATMPHSQAPVEAGMKAAWRLRPPEGAGSLSPGCRARLLTLSRGAHEPGAHAKAPDCEPGRDRLPDHAKRAVARHRDRRGLFGSRRRRPPRRRGRRSAAHRATRPRRRATSSQTRSSPQRARAAPMRSIRATASSPRTRASRRPWRTPA